MFNPIIWFRGVVASNIWLFAVLTWIVIIVMAILAVRVIVKWRRSGKTSLTVGWRVFLIIILVLNVVPYFLMWPNGLVMGVFAFSGYWSRFSFGEYFPIVASILGLVINVFCLLIFIWPKLIDKIFFKKKSGGVIAGLFLLVFFDLMIKGFLMGGFMMFSYGVTWWPGVGKAQRLNSELRKMESLPNSDKELKKMFKREVREISNYGKLCYFYDGSDGNYLLMTKMAGKWNVYDGEKYDGAMVREGTIEWEERIEECR